MRLLSLCFYSGFLFALLANAKEFTIGVIPDTQNFTWNVSAIHGMTQFYADKKDELNMVFVSHLGDMIYEGNPTHYQQISESFDILTNAGIPWSIAQGNHDTKFSLIDQYFPISRIAEQNPHFQDYFNGAYNVYFTSTWEGMDFLIVVVQDPVSSWDEAAFNWANGVIEAHPNHRVLVVIHDFIDRPNVIPRLISRHDNVFMAVAGHSCQREVHKTATSPSGKTIHLIMCDYQCDGDGGPIDRYYTFKPAEDKVCAYSYHVVRKEYQRGSSSEFCFDYEMTTSIKPVANAGTDTVAMVGSEVVFDGSQSSDGDNGPSVLSFSWTQISGPPAVLSQANTPNARFTPDASGTYVFRLTVNDGEWSDVDEVTLVVDETIVLWEKNNIYGNNPDQFSIFSLADGAILFQSSADQNHFELRLHDISGNLVFNRGIEDNRVNIKTGLPEGLYVYSVIWGRQIRKGRINLY